MSTSWVRHSREFAKKQTDLLWLAGGDWVFEIASNDGYLLKEFSALGVPVLGMEPAANVAAIACDLGVQTINGFFSARSATTIRQEHGAPSLIVANNVMAHVPDLQDFLQGLFIMADDRTVVSVENPTLTNLMNGGQFDTIYHEHFSYLSAHAVAVMAKSAGLELFDVEALATHGGSNRYWLAREGTRSVGPRVATAIEQEMVHGLMEPAVHERFATTAHSTIDGLRQWMSSARRQERRVVGYGAAAKGNTLLNAAGITSGEITAVVDASPEKQGKFLPGSLIPIHPLNDLSTLRPNDVLLLPWNLQNEVVGFITNASPHAARWVAVPQMTRF